MSSLKKSVKHFVGINWLYGIYNKDYYVFYYFYKLCATIPYTNKKFNKLICLYTSFQRAGF